jgi:threonine efflux protein
MDPVWRDILSFLTLFTLAIVSPGPNFILVVNRSLQGGRLDGAWTALGVAIGSATYGLCGLLGWIVLLDSLAHFGIVIRLIGGGYLVVLGGQMLVKFFRRQKQAALASKVQHSAGRPLMLVMTGLVTNLSNPKAWAFYLSLFTVVLTPGMPLEAKVVLNLAMFCISLGWYALVAVLISNRKIQPAFLSLQLIIQGLLGGLLIWLGLQLLWF